MSPAVDTTTRDCKQPGCTEERRYDRGVAAGLCETHGRPLMQANARRAGGASSVARIQGSAPEGSMVALVKQLTKAAKRFDRAQASYHASRGELQEAGQAFHAARKALDEAAAAALRGPSTNPEN